MCGRMLVSSPTSATQYQRHASRLNYSNQRCHQIWPKAPGGKLPRLRTMDLHQDGNDFWGPRSFSALPQPSILKVASPLASTAMDCLVSGFMAGPWNAPFGLASLLLRSRDLLTVCSAS